MKTVAKAFAGIGTLLAAVWLAGQVAGCRHADCSNSDSAKFPVVEKWWK